ncbi:kinase-like protein [Rickenella mellea]|uniref:Kinase-like protein n=1 Tax=Rickenella mellea TaxID=50990 RepID=A0A4Y7PZT0_9AGAM|nr:kinase-like protein [Rickenella mellea]
MNEQVSPQLTTPKKVHESVASPLLVRPVGQDVDSTPTHAESSRQHRLALSQAPPPPPPKSPYRRLSHLVIAPSMMTPAGCMSHPSPSSSPILPDTQGPGTHPNSTNTPRLARSCEKLTPTSHSLQSPIAQRRFSNSSIQSVTMGCGRESMSASRSPSKLRWIVSEAKIGGGTSSSPSSPEDSLGSHRQSIAANPIRAAIHLATGLLVWELHDEHAGADEMSLGVRNECRNRLQALSLSHEFHSPDMAKSEDTSDEKEQRLFYEAVEDGYVACQFVNKLKPGIIARISADRTSVARGWNVSQFLAAATTLGVPEKHLFEPSDLLECTPPDGLHRFAQTVNAIALIAGIKPNRTVVSATKPKDISREKQMEVPLDRNNLYVPPATRRSTSTPNLRSETHEAERTSPTRSLKHVLAAKAHQSQPANPHNKAEEFGYLDGPGQKYIPSIENLSPDNAEMVITIHQDDGLSTMHFQLSDYIIGRGRLGSVYRAVNLETGELVAVKRIPLRGMSEDDIRQIMNDVDLFRTLSHPHIIKYMGACRDDNFLNVVQEFAIRGSLSRTLETFGKLTERRISSYVIKILDAVNYLHRRDIVHGDLKPSKVLTTQVGDIKLSFTFGVSRGINRHQRHDVVGKPNFLAPEVIAQQGASPSSDIWSLGFAVIELLSGQPPYSEVDSALSAVMFRIVEEEMPPIPDECSEGLKDFLRSCFQKDPNKRPDAKHLGDHTWLKDNTVWSEPRSLDTIPFLRRVTNREKPTVTGTARKISPSTNTTTEEQDTSYSSGDFSELEDRVHLFFVTKFDKPVTCNICKNPFKIINGLKCTRCSATIHSRCEKKSLSNCNRGRSSDGLSSTASQSDIPPTPLPYRQSVSSTSGTMSSWESLKSLDVRLSRVFARKLKVGKEGKCVVQ